MLYWRTRLIQWNHDWIGVMLKLFHIVLVFFLGLAFGLQGEGLGLHAESESSTKPTEASHPNDHQTSHTDDESCPGSVGAHYCHCIHIQLKAQMLPEHYLTESGSESCFSQPLAYASGVGTSLFRPPIRSV